MVKMVSYKPGSNSAKQLSELLGIKRIKHHGRKIMVKGTLINWGCSQFPERIYWADNVLNDPQCVSEASNKLRSFLKFLGNVEVPAWTTNRIEALSWLPGMIVCRTVLNGHSGSGIVLAEKEEDVVGAPLYTKYIKKEHEYRIHVMNKEAFFVQRKARKLDVPDDKVNWQVRNHQNGFIYANKEIEVSKELKEIAVKAVEVLGLDFGAVDIIETKDRQPYVLEVNTAPGLSGTTLDKYAEQFRKYL